MRLRLALRPASALAVAVALGACTSVAPVRRPGHALAGPVNWPSGAVFAPHPPVSLYLTAQARGMTPDGTERWLVAAHFRDASGAPTALLHGGDVAFAPSRGIAQWQTRFAVGGPAALVATTGRGSLIVVARLTAPAGIAPARIVVTSPAAAAQVAALGPHLVQLGWFPSAPRGTVRIERTDARGKGQLVLVAAPASTYRDPTVRPGATYRYALAVPGRTRRVLPLVRVPREPRHGSLTELRGKSLWFSFSPDDRDPDAIERIDPRVVADRAAAAGIRALFVRTAYGEFWEITPHVSTAVATLLDACAARGITLVGWTVPRAATYDDLALAVATAAYRTPRGNGFAALAVDLERGPSFLGDGALGRSAIAEYAYRLRQALGPHYPIVATVEDPFLEHLGERDVPYAEIAASASVVQPMAYWRMLAGQPTTPADVRAALAGSVATLRALGVARPVLLGGQTSGEGRYGAPSPAEVATAVESARRLGTLGITFFDWTATSAGQWRALATTPW